jgi:putative transposase
MPRYVRDRTAGGTYFFTVALQDRSLDLLTRHIGTLRSAYAATAAAHPWTTIAVCVLPNHLHAIWRLPEGDADHALRWRLLKARFSSAIDAPYAANASQTARRERGIWQRRYWEHRIRDDADLEAHVHYVHYNPVKHGLVRQVADWPHSSFQRWLRAGRLPASWGTAGAPPAVRTACE